jgi:hypothetical protein
MNRPSRRGVLSIVVAAAAAAAADRLLAKPEPAKPADRLQVDGEGRVELQVELLDQIGKYPFTLYTCVAQDSRGCGFPRIHAL